MSTATQRTIDLEVQLGTAKTTKPRSTGIILKRYEPEISKNTVSVSQPGYSLPAKLASALASDSGQDQLKTVGMDTLQQAGRIPKVFAENWSM